MKKYVKLLFILVLLKSFSSKAQEIIAPENCTVGEQITFMFNQEITEETVLTWNFGDDCGINPFYKRTDCDVEIGGDNKTSHIYLQAGSFRVTVRYKGEIFTKHIIVKDNPIIQHRSNSCDLLLNSDFETNRGLPYYISQLSLVENWKSANNATPDYFHENSRLTPASNWEVGIPKNFAGNCPDPDGSAYIGLISYYETGTPDSLGDSSTVETKNYREYVFQQLTDTLIYGYEYIVQFDVRLSSFSRVHTSIGYGLSDTPVFNSSTNVLALKMITNFTDIKDTVNWYTVIDTFRATSEEKFIVIGNFTNDSIQYIKDLYPSNYIQSRYDSIKATICYYYIDDVIIKPVYIGGIIVNKDNKINAGDHVKLQAKHYLDQAFTEVSWSSRYPVQGLAGQMHNMEIDLQLYKPNTIYLYCKDGCGLELMDSVEFYINSSMPDDKTDDLGLVGVFPNPSSGSLVISNNLKEKSDFKLTIVDCLGKVVYREKLHLNDNQMKLTLPEDIKNGVYILMITQDSSSYIHKLIISR